MLCDNNMNNDIIKNWFNCSIITVTNNVRSPPIDYFKLIRSKLKAMLN